MQRVCFDHLSGTPVLPEVLDAMLPWFRQNFSGTGAVHSGGVQARTALDEARERAAGFINASSPEEILFTSSGTESINLAIKGCAHANERRGKTIVLSAIEHPAVLESVAFLEASGFKTKRIGVSQVGRINVDELAAALDDDTILVSVHAAHHDLASLQDVPRIGDILADRAIPLFVDATYAASWMRLDAQEMNASYLALAPHRFGGPKGVGILYKNRRARLTPLIHGGAQELSYRAGTENIPGIIGAGVACELAGRGIDSRVQYTRNLQESIFAGILTKIADSKLNGAIVGLGRLCNSLNLSFKGLEGEGLALALDMKGIAVTSGQACTTKASKIPATLAAIGVGEDYAPGTIIISFNIHNTTADVDYLLQILPTVVERLRSL